MRLTIRLALVALLLVVAGSLGCSQTPNTPTTMGKMEIPKNVPGGGAPIPKK